MQDNATQQTFKGRQLTVSLQAEKDELILEAIKHDQIQTALLALKQSNTIPLVTQSPVVKDIAYSYRN